MDEVWWFFVFVNIWNWLKLAKTMKANGRTTWVSFGLKKGGINHPLCRLILMEWVMVWWLHFAAWGCVQVRKVSAWYSNPYIGEYIPYRVHTMIITHVGTRIHMQVPVMIKPNWLVPWRMGVHQDISRRGDIQGITMLAVSATDCSPSGRSTRQKLGSLYLAWNFRTTLVMRLPPWKVWVCPE
jgi:hypothetical protein